MHFWFQGSTAASCWAGIQTLGNMSCGPNTDPVPFPPLLLIPGHTTKTGTQTPTSEFLYLLWNDDNIPELNRCLTLNLNLMCQSAQGTQWNHLGALGLAKSRSRIGVCRDSVVRSPQLLHLLSFAYQSCLGGERGRARENAQVCNTTGLGLVSGLGFFQWKHKLRCSLAPLNISKLLHFGGICKLSRSTSQCVCIFF